MTRPNPIRTVVRLPYTHLFYIKEKQNIAILTVEKRQGGHWNTTVSSMAARHWTMLEVISTSTCSPRCLLGS